MDRIDINAPQFTGSDLAHVAGLDSGLLKLWVRRGLLQPTRIERLAIRQRPHFSVVAIFKAKLMRLVGETLSIGPALVRLAADQAEDEANKKQGKLSASAAAKLSRVLADEGWMWAVARSVETGKALPVFAAVTLTGDCWNFILYVGEEKIAPPFGADVPYAFLPVGPIFASVYNECRHLLRGYPAGKSKKPRKAPRARS